jgi:hypothetical protein
MKQILTLILCLSSMIGFSQTGIIKGKVIDKQSEKPLAGASVELVNSSGNTVITDADGNFRLSNVPLGRQVVRITFVGYENILIPDIDVTSGKDNILTVAIAEKFSALQEVVVKANG